MASTIPNQLRYLREQLKIPKKRVAEELGLSYSTYNNWETGATEPNSETLTTLADYFDVSVDFLMGRRDNVPVSLSSDEVGHIGKYRVIDKYGKKNVDVVLDNEYDRCVSSYSSDDETITVEMRVYDEPAAAGYGNYLTGDSYELINFPAEDVPRSADFGVRISGDSMEPKINDGQIVWVEGKPVINNGEIGVFILNGDSFCKKLSLDHEHRVVRLLSINRAYDHITITEDDDLRTVGRVLI